MSHFFPRYFFGNVDDGLCVDVEKFAADAYAIRDTDVVREMILPKLFGGQHFMRLADLYTLLRFTTQSCSLAVMHVVKAASAAAGTGASGASTRRLAAVAETAYWAKVDAFFQSFYWWVESTDFGRRCDARRIHQWRPPRVPPTAGAGATAGGDDGWRSSLVKVEHARQ